MWSVFIGVVKKSNRNMQACSNVGLVCKVGFFFFFCFPDFDCLSF